MSSLYTRKDSKFIYLRFYNPEKKKGDSISTGFLKDDKKGWEKAEEFLEAFDAGLKDAKVKHKFGIEVKRKKDLKAGYQDFVDYKVQAKEKTMEAYRLAYEHMLKACGNKPLDKFTQRDYLLLIHHFRHEKGKMGEKSLSPATQNIYLRHLSAMWKYFIKQKWVSDNIIEKVKETKKKPEAIPADDLQVILDHFRRTNKKHYYTVRLLLVTGWRVSTLLAQRWEKINFGSDKFVAKNIKANQEFDYPLHSELREVLMEIGLKKTGPLVEYASYYGVRDFWDDGLNKLLHREVKDPKTGETKKLEPLIRKKYTLHQLRKTFNSILANLHIDAKDLKTLLDHSDIKVTLDNYTEINMSRLKKEIDKTVKFPK